MQPDYGSCWDIVSYYADLLALATESLAVNITNSKLAYVFACQDKTVAESFKKMFDQINEGNPAVFAFATNENAANYTAVLKKNDTEVDAAEPVVGEGTVSVATGTLEAGTYSLTLTANAETG